MRSDKHVPGLKFGLRVRNIYNCMPKDKMSAYYRRVSFFDKVNNKSY
jgi:hypothetical protein